MSTHAAIFPQVDVHIIRDSGVASTGLDGVTVGIELFSGVRISDDEGNYFFTPVRSFTRCISSLHGERDARHLSEAISRFMTAVYKLILSETFDATVVDPKTGVLIYTPDPRTISERQRMGLEPVSPVAPMSSSMDMYKMTGTFIHKELLTPEQIRHRYPLSEEEAFELSNLVMNPTTKPHPK